MTVIENKNAPERYEYKLDIKGGYVLTESFGENGKKGIAVLNSDQSDLIAMIDTAWAKDGSGKDIETYYEIKGQTIVQVVKHKVKGTVYPVSADPYVGNVYFEKWGWNNWGSKIFFNRTQTYQVKRGLSYMNEFSIPTSGFTTYASDIYDRGNCLGLYQWFSAVWGFEWNTKYCKEGARLW